MSFIYLYFLSLVLLLTSSNWLMLWFMLEFNMICLSVYLLKCSSFSNVEPIVKYYIFQSINSLFLLIMVLFVYSSLFSQFTLLVLLMNLGLPPFHFWFLESVNSVDLWSMFYLLCWQKLPFKLFISGIMLKLSMTIFVLVVLISVLLVFLCSSIIIFYIFSSFIHSVWILSSVWCSLLLFFEYIVVYFTLSLCFFSQGWLLSVGGLMVPFCILILLVISGIPPLAMFWLKWKVLSGLFFGSLFLGLFLLASSIIMVYLYFKLFNYLFNFKTVFYLQSELVALSLLFLPLFSWLVLFL